MKRIAKVLILAGLMALGAEATQAQIVVRIRPRHERVVVRPPAPSPRHVWVDEDWRAHGRGYQWQGGRWVAPPREGATYIQGHWDKRRGGEVWVAGHWN